MKVWLNCEIMEEESAKVSIRTHALHYGTAVFEGIRFFNTSKGTVIFRLKDHIERLFKSADALGMNVPFSRNDMIEGIKSIIKENGFSEGYIRPIIFYGDDSISVFPDNVSVNGAVFISNFRASKDGLSLKVSDVKKVSDLAKIPGAKVSGFYANSVIAIEEAKKKGFDDALMLDENGHVSEGSIHNFFIVKDNLLITPLGNSGLLGITRDTILEIAKTVGCQTIEKDISVDEATSADEAFFCSTGSGIKWISEINNLKISDEAGEITKKLKEKYAEIITGNDDIFSDWLFYV